ncbi:MAG: hypothetical protein AABX54_03685 [Nanoarchaeota archaeon]
MSNLETDLKNLVSEELVEVAWHADYPLNQGIGLWSFIQAFQRGGFIVDVNHGEKKAEFFLTREVLGEHYEFHSQMSFDQISRGWGRGPKGSPPRLYDSICAIYDLMEREKFPRKDLSSDNLNKRNFWQDFRYGDSKRVRRLMEEEMKVYFDKYQEHLFIPVSGNVPKLTEPRLIHRVMEEFPLFLFDLSDNMRDLRFLAEEAAEKNGFDSLLAVGTPCAETMLEGFNVDDFHPGFYPSESTLIDLFLGRYLHRFSLIKGYNTWNKENQLRDFVVSKRNAFSYGCLLGFPDEIRNTAGIFY